MRVRPINPQRVTHPLHSNHNPTTITTSNRRTRPRIHTHTTILNTPRRPHPQHTTRRLKRHMRPIHMRKRHRRRRPRSHQLTRIHPIHKQPAIQPLKRHNRNRTNRSPRNTTPQPKHHQRNQQQHQHTNPPTTTTPNHHNHQPFPLLFTQLARNSFRAVEAPPPGFRPDPTPNPSTGAGGRPPVWDSSGRRRERSPSRSSRADLRPRSRR
jgi:hypothetical protein